MSALFQSFIAEQDKTRVFSMKLIVLKKNQTEVIKDTLQSLMQRRKKLLTCYSLLFVISYSYAWGVFTRVFNKNTKNKIEEVVRRMTGRPFPCINGCIKSNRAIGRGKQNH